VTLSYTYDGAAITQKIAPSGINITHRADGDPSQGGLPIEDPAAALTMVGWKPVTVEESACSQPRLFTGFTMQRDIGRSVEGGLFVGEDARLQDLTIVDLNAIFGFRQITGSDGNRPAETWAARLTWILESEYLSDWISADQTWVVTNTTSMEETDYREAYAAGVMEDLVDRSGGAYLYFAFWDTSAAPPEVRLFFDNDNETLGLSTISISNDWDDVDNDYVFALNSVAVLAREADQTYSDVVVTYDRGAKKVYRYRQSTATAYIRRGTGIQRPYTRGLATATAQAEAFLDKHAVEVDRITCSIQVPANRVGLIEAGQGMSVRFTHLPGYETVTVMRVVSYSPRPTNDLATHYDVALELVYQPAVAPPEPECSFVAPDYPAWSSLDVFGSAYDYLDQFDPASPVYPATEYISYHWGIMSGAPLFQYGTINGGGVCGVGSDVIAGDINLLATWTFDLAPLGTPPICVAKPSMTYAYSVEGSDDGDSWTEYVAAGDGLTALPEPYPVHRWWRLVARFIQSGSIRYFGGPDGAYLMLWGATGGDEIIDLGPTPGATTEHITDPTVNDDAAAGYTVGSVWINETTGEAFILVDSTTGAAVWVSTTATGAPTTADYLVGTAQAGLSAEIVVGTTPGGELGGTWASPTVDATHSGSAHHAAATISGNGLDISGQEISLDLSEVAAGGELAGYMDAPTVDATHSGSAHLALGSTSSTAAAGDHTHSGAHILLADGRATPFTFDDLLQMDDGSDFMWSD